MNSRHSNWMSLVFMQKATQYKDYIYCVKWSQQFKIYSIKRKQDEARDRLEQTENQMNTKLNDFLAFQILRHKLYYIFDKCV